MKPVISFESNGASASGNIVLNKTHSYLHTKSNLSNVQNGMSIDCESIL